MTLTIGCGGAPAAPPGARTTVLSLRKLDCSTCGDELANKLQSSPRVIRASFDRRRAEITVVASRSVDALSAARALVDESDGYEIVEGAGRGEYKPWARAPEGADVRSVNRDGEDVSSLDAVVAQGKVTVVDFSAAWCEPCRVLDDHIMGLVRKRTDLAYRKLDVGDWDTPLAKHYLSRVKSLPYVIVFDRRGVKVDEVSGLDLVRIDAAIDKGQK